MMHVCKGEEKHVVGRRKTVSIDCSSSARQGRSEKKEKVIRENEKKKERPLHEVEGQMHWLERENRVQVNPLLTLSIYLWSTNGNIQTVALLYLRVDKLFDGIESVSSIVFFSC